MREEGNPLARVVSDSLSHIRPLPSVEQGATYVCHPMKWMSFAPGDPLCFGNACFCPRSANLWEWGYCFLVGTPIHPDVILGHQVISDKLQNDDERGFRFRFPCVCLSPKCRHSQFLSNPALSSLNSSVSTNEAW